MSTIDIQAEMRRAKCFSTMQWWTGTRAHAGWHAALAGSLRNLANDPAFIDAVERSVGVSPLPKGVKSNENLCPIARATGAYVEIDWSDLPVEQCCFAQAFDMGYLPQYEMSDEEEIALHDAQTADQWF